MNIFNSIHDFKADAQTVLTLGTFDGVHIGHRKIIDQLVKSAAEEGCQSVILTFFPHPRMVLKGDSNIQLLNTMAEKAVLLESAGLQNLVIHPFDKQFAGLSADEFVRTLLIEAFNIKKIIIGHDHRFGHNRTANIDDLVIFGKEYNFEVEQISAEMVDEVSVSSTKIRQALLKGDMMLANEYLGYDYLLTGTIVHGKKLGRTIGYPTANIKISEPYKLIPQQGVYAVKSVINGKLVLGMMNIGTNPTVGGQTLSIEVHFFNFNQDLYDQEISVGIVKRLRDEEKFDSIEELKNKLAEDQIAAMACFIR